MRSPALLFLALVMVCPPWVRPVAARDYRVSVAASDVDRAGSLVTLALPKDAPKDPVLRDAAGKTLPLQVEADGSARFVVPAQKAGAVLAFTLVSGAQTARDAVSVSRDQGDVRVRVGGQPLLSYRTDRNVLPRADIKPEIVRAGYIHPIFSPAGKLVTDDYPSNHAHHHGIWAPWTKTKFQGRTPDFWNMQDKTGAEEFVALERTWSGPVHGGFSARHQMIDSSAPQPVAALNVTWELTAYALDAARAVRMFDLLITQTCATTDPLILPQYHYGGFGFRGAGAWNGPGEAARFLTSEGLTDRIQGNNTRARWCYLGGQVEGGALAGTATLGHPANLRAPQPVRLHPNMPYFSLVPQQLGEFQIEPGRPYVARFRFVVMDGPPDRALLDAYWNGYARPATGELTPL